MKEARPLHPDEPRDVKRVRNQTREPAPWEKCGVELRANHTPGV